MLGSNISSSKSCSTVYKLCDLGFLYYKITRLIQLLHHEVVKMETTWVKSWTQCLCNHSCHSPNISGSPPCRHTIELYLSNLKLGVVMWLALANGTWGNLIWHCWSYQGWCANCHVPFALLGRPWEHRSWWSICWSRSWESVRGRGCLTTPMNRYTEQGKKAFVVLSHRNFEVIRYTALPSPSCLIYLVYSNLSNYCQLWLLRSLSISGL